MKQPHANRRQLVTAGIWSLAVLALLAVGTMTLFSAASRKTKNETSKKDKETELVTMLESADPAPETEDAGFFKPANPLDTEIVGETETVPEDKPTMEEIIPEEQENDLPTAAFDNGENFRAVMPVHGEIAKDFTEDVAVYSLTMNDYRVHQGIDIAAPVGTNVTACADGVVERVWLDPFYGQCVEINHGGNIKSQYANLSADLPRGMEAGVTVLAGDVIGGVGETMIIEMADSEHLHFSMTVDGVYVDPTEYMK